MKAMALTKIILFSLAVAILGRLGSLELQSWENRRLTADLCAAAGNYLETGNLREAFESLEYGASRAKSGRACVSVIDNGRSFAPNCVDERISYQTVTCHADANKGVRAQVMYPKGEVFARELLTLWAVVAIVLSLLILLLRMSVAYLSSQLLQELRETALGESRSNDKNIAARFFDGVLERTGIRAVIHAQAQSFEEKIKAYEFRLVSEAEIRTQREAEVTRSRDYAEKIKKIRHDIRSPLSGLLAVQEAVGTSDGLLSSTITSVVRGLRDLVERINDLESEEATPSLTIVEVVAEEAVKTTRLKFQKAKKVTIRLQYEKELSPVFAVAGALRRIFENLLENAFDAVSTGGLINITVRNTAKDCQIIFEDNGCGLSPEQIPRLFQEGATFGKVGGTGLGLYHAKQSLQAWGGAISFENNANGGARFILSIPIAQMGVVYVAPPASPKKVLVVDDDPKVASLLARSGHEVVGVAESFEEALSLLSRARPEAALVLIDHELGGRKGTDLIAEIPNRRNFYLCTNDFDREDTVRRAREVGVNIIPKPLLLKATQPAQEPILTLLDGFERISDHGGVANGGDAPATRI